PAVSGSCSVSVISASYPPSWSDARESPAGKAAAVERSARRASTRSGRRGRVASSVVTIAGHGGCSRRRPLGPNRLFPQDLLQRLALREFIDELVEIADLPHQRVLDLLHPDAAHHALDQGRIRVEFRRFGEEGFEIVVRSDLRAQTLGAVTGQPAD